MLAMLDALAIKLAAQGLMGRRPSTRSGPTAGWSFARRGALMSKLSPRAEKALSELEALAKSRTAERAAQPAPKPSPADHIDALTKSFVTTSRRARATKPAEAS
jgi:hypothetical protein